MANGTKTKGADPALTAAAGSEPDELTRKLKRFNNARRYKVVGNYLYPPIESTEEFETLEEASAENRRITDEAEAKGLRWRGRPVPFYPQTIEVAGCEPVTQAQHNSANSHSAH
jgi:hypothetical protein